MDCQIYFLVCPPEGWALFVVLVILLKGRGSGSLRSLVGSI